MEIKTINLGKVCITPKGIWDNNKTYERLDLVYCRQTKASYVAKQDVPIDIEIANEKYWQILNASDFIQIVEYIDYKFEKLIEYTYKIIDDKVENELEALNTKIDDTNNKVNDFGNTINNFTTSITADINAFKEDINNQMNDFYDNQDDKFNTFKDDINDIIDERVNNAITPVAQEAREYADGVKQYCKSYTDISIGLLQSDVNTKVAAINRRIDEINSAISNVTNKVAFINVTGHKNLDATFAFDNLADNEYNLLISTLNNKGCIIFDINYDDMDATFNLKTPVSIEKVGANDMNIWFIIENTLIQTKWTGKVCNSIVEHTIVNDNNIYNDIDNITTDITNIKSKLDTLPDTTNYKYVVVDN